MSVSKLIVLTMSCTIVLLGPLHLAAQENEVAESPASEAVITSAQNTSVMILPVVGAAPQVFTFNGSSMAAPIDQPKFELLHAPSSMPNAGSALDLVSIPSVLKELEIVDDQLEQVHAVQREFIEQLARQMKELRERSISGDQYTEFLRTQQAIKKKRIEEILLPHQQKRLQQIDFQMKTKGLSHFAGNRLHPSVADKLGLSEEQQKALKKKSLEITKRLNEAIKRMRAEAKEELLSVLTAQQRAKFSELSGAKYEEKPGDWRDYIKKHGPKQK